MCTFCKIVKGDLPCYEVYSSKDVTAFLDIHPTVPGHTVIIPNIHVERLDQLQDPKVASALMQAIIDVPRILIEAGICTDFTILSDNGVHADQDIPHVHFHVIPRHAEEDFLIESPTNSQASKKEELRRIWTKIHKNHA